MLLLCYIISSVPEPSIMFSVLYDVTVPVTCVMPLSYFVICVTITCDIMLCLPFKFKIKKNQVYYLQLCNLGKDLSKE